MTKLISTEPFTNNLSSYFAVDGNYGSADGIVLCQTQFWTEEDWAEVENCTDSERGNKAVEVSRQYGNLLMDLPDPDTI